MTAVVKMTRSQSREVAFTLLFEKTFTDDPLDEIVLRAGEASDRLFDAFALSLAEGALRHLEEVDAVLSSSSKNWKLSRVSRVALSALRIAAYEMLFVEDIPSGVSINEAVELAKKYASSEDAAYVNGVLGAIARKDEGLSEARAEA